ncbi:MAG: hypothetical protein U9P49_13100 [Thermodesulfobacteriota bacterium]|nr:hypothetical protein [Thermodesulfobacteriota bacterium]
MNIKKDKKRDEPVYQNEFFETTSVTDFVLKEWGTPPEGYPEKEIPDKYSKIPFSPDYNERREAFFSHCLKNPAAKTIKGYYYELVRLYREKSPVHEGAIYGALNYINRRYDCSDFVMLGIIRLIYQFKDSKLISKELKEKAEKTVLDFKYWPDEPGIDSMCWWTENHQIMFSSNEYLAGQLFPDRVFTNSGMRGMEKTARAKKRILGWMDLRFKTGFSEWLSHIYYDEDITPLINLIDFCDDPRIVNGAEIVTDLIIYDMALNSLCGVFGSTHGRSYTREKKSALFESTTDTQKLMFGMGIFSGADNMSAVTIALSEKYRMPRVIYDIATDSSRDEMINKQRMGIRIKEAGRWGLNFKDLESGMIFLSLEAYTHPKTFRLVMKMFDEYRWWENQFFTMFKSKKWLIDFLRYTGLIKPLAYLLEKDITRNTREEVNIYTYKTPEYMLSSAQDYRKGYGGDQQHIWQATLSPETVCFTTHPGRIEDTSPGYWVGSGSLPRVAQIENVVIAVYNISTRPGLYLTNKIFFTHAWFPRDKYDEVAQKNGWIFGRKGDGYIALYSQNAYKWQAGGEDANREIIADGKKNIWICEMGRKDKDGDFQSFIEKISGSIITFRGLKVFYESPSQGKVEFGWRGPLRQDGKIIEIKDYPRYDNPYSNAEFPPEEIYISSKDSRLRLNPLKGIREASEYV